MLTTEDRQILAAVLDQAHLPPAIERQACVVEALGLRIDACRAVLEGMVIDMEQEEAMLVALCREIAVMA